MSLFESASLCVTPNGTKASKLYAVKPVDGSGDLTVTRATTATRVNSAGLIESVAVNVPRLDYTDSTCPSILVEPQRTNNFSYSNNLSDVSWAKLSMAVTENYATSPSGLNDGIRLVSSGGSNSFLFKLITSTSGTVYTVSCFVKSNTNQTVRLYGGDFGIGNSPNLNVTNTWQKISYTFTPNANGVVDVGLRTNSNNTNFDILVYGFQLEVGSYATSYIPTTSASVTRNADVISKTGISSLIGQTEGAVFVDYFEKNGLGIIPLRINGSDGKFIWIRGTGAMFFGNSSALLFNNFGTPTANQRYKIAFVYGQNDFRLFVNGSFVSSVTTGTFTGTFSDVQLPALPNEDPFGQQYFVNSLQLYKTKLTNSELATLTTI